MKTDIRTLDLNLLKALDALLDERSVTRAAERLSLTQPAVSGMLNRLRECFDDPLFTRTQRGITPTLRASELAQPIKSILAEVSELLQPKAFDPASADMTIKIAATDYALRAVIVPFMAALRQRAPDVRVAVLPVNNEQLSAQFERGDIDFALITPETAPPGLHAHTLYEEQYVCLIRKGHPLTQPENQTLNSFCEMDHALVSYTDGGFYGVTDEALTALNLKRRVTLSVCSFLVLPEILRFSDMVSVVPRRLAMHLPGLTVLPPPLTIPGFTKIVVWHERTHRDAGHRWLRELLFSIVI